MYILTYIYIYIEYGLAVYVAFATLFTRASVAIYEQGFHIRIQNWGWATPQEIDQKTRANNKHGWLTRTINRHCIGRLLFNHVRLLFNKPTM